MGAKVLEFHVLIDYGFHIWKYFGFYIWKYFGFHFWKKSLIPCLQNSLISLLESTLVSVFELALISMLRNIFVSMFGKTLISISVKTLISMYGKAEHICARKSASLVLPALIELWRGKFRAFAERIPAFYIFYQIQDRQHPSFGKFLLTDWHVWCKVFTRMGYHRPFRKLISMETSLFFFFLGFGGRFQWQKSPKWMQDKNLDQNCSKKSTLELYIIKYMFYKKCIGTYILVVGCQAASPVSGQARQPICGRVTCNPGRGKWDTLSTLSCLTHLHASADKQYLAPLCYLSLICKLVWPENAQKEKFRK